MKRLLPIICFYMLASCSDRYMLKHGRDRVPCNPGMASLMKCNNCLDGVYKPDIRAITVPTLLFQRDTSRSTFYMFVQSRCPYFPNTMPPYLQLVTSMDSIDPVLILVDDYSDLPDSRKRLASWGWAGPVYILDQDHYGCFYDDYRARNKTVLEEFGIQEEQDYYLTVSLEVMVDPEGHVTGYSNYHDLPGELRGTNIPKY